MKKLLLLIGFTVASVFVSAKNLDRLGLTNCTVQPSPIKNIDVVIADQGIFYVTKDEKYLFSQLLDISSGKPIFVDEQYMAIKNKKFLPELNNLRSSMIVFPAQQEKYVVNVFFDYTCHYCHKLFAEIPEYNKLGITLRFLASPRDGLNNNTAKYMETIFTSKDPVAALTRAEKGELPKEQKKPNIVKTHAELAEKFGVTGTPSLVLADGELIRGYVAPEELLKKLQDKAKK